MQVLATADEMRQFDRKAIERGMPGSLLMENAGRGVVDVLEAKGVLASDLPVVIVAGKGNNGGDGFVIARHVLARGKNVELYPVAEEGALAGDALLNWNILKRNESPALKIHSVAETGSAALSGSVLVDALLGTGFSGTVEGPLSGVIRWMNTSGLPILAVDVPSGVHAGTGKVGGEAVRATWTATMGLAKPGLYLGSGMEHAGEVVVVDLGVPCDWFEPGVKQVTRCAITDVRRNLPGRSPRAHKYAVGKVLVVAGSRSFTGAPCLASQAALKAGAGAVRLCVPDVVVDVVASKLTEVIVGGVASTREGTFAAEAWKQLEKHLKWADVVALGPGLDRNPETDALVRRLVADVEKPLVLDADGLNAFEGQPFPRRSCDTVLTPHAGELSRLTGTPAAKIEQDPLSCAREAAHALGATVVLKGAPSVTAYEGGSVVLNSTGNPGMATVGAGDVLTGLLAGLMAQGMPGTTASWTATFIHGLAGDHAARQLGIRSLCAGDILGNIADAFCQIEGVPL